MSKFSYDALKVLRMVCAACGQCGKYLVASMAIQLDGLERHGERAFGVDRCGSQVREELLAMSSASIDRYLRGARPAEPGFLEGPEVCGPARRQTPGALLRVATTEPLHVAGPSGVHRALVPLPAGLRS